MRLACVRVYVCAIEKSRKHTRRIQFCRFPCTNNQAGVTHCRVLRDEGEIPAMFAWTSHSLLWRQSRQEPASVHTVQSRLFSKKPRARERGAPGLTPRSRSLFFTDFIFSNFRFFWTEIREISGTVLLEISSLCLLHSFPLLSPPFFILGLICRWLSRRNKDTTAIYM